MVFHKNTVFQNFISMHKTFPNIPLCFRHSKSGKAALLPSHAPTVQGSMSYKKLHDTSLEAGSAQPPLRASSPPPCSSLEARGKGSDKSCADATKLQGLTLWLSVAAMSSGVYFPTSAGSTSESFEPLADEAPSVWELFHS